MGARAQVKIKTSPKKSVYLYTHWGAESLEQDVARALAKRWRWSDSGYLARIIFEEMVGDKKGTETGFGIDTEQHGDIEKLIKINTEKETIKSIDIWRRTEVSYTFEEFIERFNVKDGNI